MDERNEGERDLFSRLAFLLGNGCLALYRERGREGERKNGWRARGKHAAREGGRVCEGE